MLHDEARGWLFLIEAVTSHGPVSPKQIFEIPKMLKDSRVGPFYVSAFPNLAKFERWVSEVARGTKFW